MRPTKDIFALGLSHAKRVIHSGHDLIPAVFIYGDDHCIALPLQGRDERTNLALKLFSFDMVRTGLASDQIIGVDTVNEIWTADVSMADFNTGRITHASEHPDRKACVLVCAWGAEGRRAVTYEIVTRPEGRLIGEPVHVNKELQTWLDPLFSEKPTLPDNIIMKAALVSTYQRLALMARRGDEAGVINFALDVADNANRRFD